MTTLTAAFDRIRLVVADDHLIVREGIAGLADAEAGMAVVAQAENGRDAIDAFRQHRPDVTLMDLQMPGLGGIEAITAIRREFPGARIVVLTTYSGDIQAAHALRAGACGYLLKTMIRAEMLNAIRAAHAGNNSLPPALAGTMAAYAGEHQLSPREIEVLRMVANSGRNKLVAAEMGITEGTVKVHMKNILTKLEANDRVQAVMIALRRGIIHLDR